MNSRGWPLALLAFFWSAALLGAAEPKPAPLTPKLLQQELARKPTGAAAEELGRRVINLFGRQALAAGRTQPRIEGTVVAWAVQSKEPATIIKGDGKPIGPMIRLGNTDIQALAMTMPNFTEFSFVIQAAGKRLSDSTVRIEHYDFSPDSLPHDDVPKGKVTRHEWKSEIYTNTVREYLVYVPAQYDPAKPACVMIFQDGLRHADPTGQVRATVVMDNLIHKKDMPVTIGIFINPGLIMRQGKAAVSNRSVEYDTPSDTYARFLKNEILVEVGKNYNLRKDPASYAICGGSSGGICAWSAAWFMPDQFGKVFSWVGSFTDIRGGYIYPALIRKTERKPIRVFLLDGSNDLDNRFGNWPLANQQMAAALKFAGYDYKFEFGECFHGSKHAGAILPDVMRWLWRDWEKELK